MAQQITVSTHIACPRQKVWHYYTEPSHIVQWNFAEDTWHCPHASNDLRIGGQYLARMEAKDGSFAFDFTAIYTAIDLGKSLAFTLFDNRHVQVEFQEQDQHTLLTVTFDAEHENPIKVQQQGWQNILDHLKIYAEKH